MLSLPDRPLVSMFIMNTSKVCVQDTSMFFSCVPPYVIVRLLLRKSLQRRTHAHKKVESHSTVLEERECMDIVKAGFQTPLSIRLSAALRHLAYRALHAEFDSTCSCTGACSTANRC